MSNARWTAQATLSTASPTTTITTDQSVLSSDMVILALNYSSSNPTTVTPTSPGATFTPMLPVTAVVNSSMATWTATGLTPGAVVTITCASAQNGAAILAGYTGQDVGTNSALAVHAASPDTTTLNAPAFTADAAGSLIVDVWGTRLGSGNASLNSVSIGTIDLDHHAGLDGCSLALSSYTAASTAVGAVTGTWSTGVHNAGAMQIGITQAAAPTATRWMRAAGAWVPATLKTRIGGAWVTMANTAIASPPAGGAALPANIPFTL